MLILDLVRVPADTRGIYTINGVPGRMPTRMLWLHPQAAASLPLWAVVSDMYRSPASSLQAVREGRGAQPPGYSLHNYGIAIDLDVDATMRGYGNSPSGARAPAAKAGLDEAMERRGWFCHRRDHQRGHEDWHYNYLGPDAVISPKVKTTINYAEQRVLQLYGAELDLNEWEAQRALAMLGLYHDKIDGVLGPMTRQAVLTFQAQWGLPQTGQLNTRTKRTLAYVASDWKKTLEPPATTR